MQMNDIDWNAVLENVTAAIPTVAQGYFGMEAIKAQADAAAAARTAPNYGLPMPSSYYSLTGRTGAAYSPVYGAPQQSGSDILPMVLILGGIGIAGYAIFSVLGSKSK
jgi:hypothetical protein